MKLLNLLCLSGFVATNVQAAGAAPSGNDVLARAATAQGLSSYSAPVHFDVHMHKPIGIKSGADGVAYFKAPANAAIAITHIPGLLGGFFKGSYTLDMVPQTWPSKYTVTSVSDDNGAYLLEAAAKSDPSIDHVEFTVTSDYQPTGAHWFYKDGSSIVLTIQNQKLQGYDLPQTENISVSMPKYGLDATATYGSYSINTPVPDSVFAR